MTIALVANTTVKAATNGTTPAVNTTGANFLVIILSYFTGTTPTVHDSFGNTYTALTAYASSSSAITRLFYSTPTTVGTGHTFGFTGTNCYVSLEALAFSGMATSSVYQGLQSGAGSTGTTVQPGSLSPTGPTLLISGAGWNASATASINSSFAITNQNNYTAGTSFGGAAAYLIQAAGSAINPTWTISGGQPLVATMAAFSGAAVSTAGPTWMQYGFGF